MTPKARSMMPWTSSGSRRSDMAVKPDTSENITVTRLRSPSRAPLEVRIFSARCFGVYVEGAASRNATGGGSRPGAWDAGAGGTAASAVPHSLQNFCPAGFGWAQAGQARRRLAPHSPQNLLSAAVSARHDGHFTLVSLLIRCGHALPEGVSGASYSNRLEKSGIPRMRKPGFSWPQFPGIPRLWYQAFPLA